jgi:hypothetical protein
MAESLTFLKLFQDSISKNYVMNPMNLHNLTTLKRICWRTDTENKRGLRTAQISQ